MTRPVLSSSVLCSSGLLCLLAPWYALAQGMETPATSSDTEVPIIELPETRNVPSAVALDPVVVTGTRTEHRLSDSPVEVQVITAQDIARTGARDLAELLEREGSVHVTRAAGRGSTIEIQGLSSEHVLILINGRRLIGRVNGAIDLSRIRVAEIQRVEIVKGATSALYGSDALGGVVNIITRKGAEPLTFTLRGSERGDADMFAYAGWAGRDAGVQASGGLSRVQAFDRDRSTPSEDGVDSEAGFFSLSGDWQMSRRANLGAHFAYSLEDTERLDGATQAGLFETRKRIEEVRGGLSPEFELGDATTLKTDLYYHRYFDQYLQQSVNSNATTADEETIDQIVAGSAQIDHQLEDHRIALGLDLQTERLQADRIDETAERDRVAVFVQDEWNLPMLGLTIVPGLRFDDDSQFGHATTPKIAVRYDLTSNWMLRPGWGEGFRAPDFKQLLLRFDNPAVGYRVEGNPALRPERSRGFNLSTTWYASTTSSLHVSAYHQDVDDLIQVEQTTSDTDAGVVFTYNNVASARLSGVDLQTQWHPIAPLQLKLGYGYLRSRDRDTGERLSGRPAHRANLAVYWMQTHYAIGLRGVWVGDREFTAEVSTGPPTAAGRADPYTLFDLRFDWTKWRWVDLAVGLDNLLDEGDSTYLPIAPRTAYLELKRTF